MPPTASIFKRYLWSVPVVIIAIIMALLYRDKTDEKHGQRQIWLLIIGTLLGATLSYFDYCFSCAFKSLLLFGEGRKFRAMLFMFFITTLAVAYVYGEHDGEKSYLYPQKMIGIDASPSTWVHLSLALACRYVHSRHGGGGGELQYAGRCASGVLYQLGNGEARSAIVLLFFMVGAVLATSDKVYDWWSNTEEIPGMSTGSWLLEMDFSGALMYQILILGSMAGITMLIEFKRFGKMEEFSPSANPEYASLLPPINNGPNAAPKVPLPFRWYGLYVAGIIFAVLELVLYMSKGGLWGVMGVFAPLFCDSFDWVIGCRDWTYYATAIPDNFMCTNFGICDTFITDLAIILGAFIVSSARGKFGENTTSHSFSLISVTTAIIGGICLGFGARLAYGCNVGSLFAGIASMSRHAYVWFFGSICGNALGVYSKKWFQIDE